MVIIGLTGSMGMGKSTAADRFRQLGIAVFDADADVHRLYNGPLTTKIEAAFPGTTIDGKVDRAKLSQALLSHPDRFQTLEAIVHPAVRQSQSAVLNAEAANGAKLTVLEIPLLYENGGETRVDAVIVVSANPDVQRQRLMARSGMTREKIDTLLARQMPDAEKRGRADFVIDTNGPVSRCHDQVDDIIGRLAGWPCTAYDRHWRSASPLSELNETQ
ncbi:MAG: dephospho-CoA kinase [Hyphomicrobium sp.]|nr:dephospho-CoA kinase [Hyphomicrobium sp.]